MKRHPSKLLLLLLAIVTIPPSSQADGDKNVRKELTSNYAKIVKGFKSNDPTVWEGFLIPEFTLKLFNGSVQDHGWVVDYIRNNAKTFKVQKLSMRIKELTIQGVDATTVVEQKSSRTFNDEQGKSHQLDVGAIQREIWTKTSDGWRLKSVEE